MKSRSALLACAAFGLVLSGAPDASAFCPSYTASSPNNDGGCAIEAADGENPSVDEWNAIFDLVSRGPASWGDAGPTVSDIGQGCGAPEPLHDVAARFPCELLKGIARQESGWRQFCVPDTPGDQVGGNSRTIISFDCGYGVGQVTSGMHVGETPDFDRDRVASDATYNLATGTRILASKWSYTECVGDNQPTLIEHWYTATWAYNGLAYVNNPNNPNYDPNRGVWDPSVGGAAPYQEKVFGWIEHTGGNADPVELAYPNPGDIGGGTSPGPLPDPACASPTDCVTTRSTHTTACIGGTGAGGAGGGSGSGAGGTGDGGATSAGNGASNGVGAGSTGSGGSDLDPGDDPGAVHGSCSCRAAGVSGGGGGGGADASWLVAFAAFLAAAPYRRRGAARRASRQPHEGDRRCPRAR